VQGTVAYASGYTTAGIPAPFYNLIVADASAGTWAAQNAVPFLYGIRQASGAWCTMMRPSENIAGAWPTTLEAMTFVEHDLTAAQKTEAAQTRVAAAQATAQAAASGNGGGGISATTINGDDELPHRRASSRRDRSPHR